MQNNTFLEEKDLKKIFREGVKLLHPDKGGDPEKFYKFLTWYRRLSKSSITPRRIDLSYGSQHLSSSSIFKSITFSIKEVSLGLRKKIKVPFREIDCPSCNGSGRDQNSLREICNVCNGEGVLKFSSKEGFTYQKCTFCSGRGYYFKESCSSCMGKGKIKEEREIEITIPLGLREGDLLHIPKGYLGTQWDIYIEVELEKHPFWRFEGNDLIYELKIPFWEIMLKEFIEIETLEGKEAIPTLFFTRGEPVVLSRRGPFLPEGNFWRRGDLIIELKPLFPSSIPPKAKRYLERLKNLLTEVEKDGTGVNPS